MVPTELSDVVEAWVVVVAEVVVVVAALCLCSTKQGIEPFNASSACKRNTHLEVLSSMAWTHCHRMANM